MKIDNRHIAQKFSAGAAAYRRLAGRALALIAFVLLTAGSPPGSRPDIQVISQQKMNIGKVLRNQERTIDYNGPYAAHVVVVGKAGENVRIRVSQAYPLSRAAGGSSIINIDLTPEQIAYSLDNGATWTVAMDGNLRIDTRFPPGVGSQTSRILLRIGAIISTKNNQRRGAYQGRISVSASYRN